MRVQIIFNQYSYHHYNFGPRLLCKATLDCLHTQGCIQLIPVARTLFPSPKTPLIVLFIFLGLEWLSAEKPNSFTCSIQPGVVETKMLERSELSGLPMDSVKLPAHFLVWLAKEKTKFLNGRFVFANWDVDELCEQADKIAKSSIMTINAVGWPYAHVG